MSGWDLDSNSSSGGTKADFTKFPVGITRIRVISEAPISRWVHFLPQFKRSVNCPGKGCPMCEIRKQQKANKQPYTYQMGKRYAVNVINRETGKVEVCDQGVTFFQDLRDVMTDLQSEGKTLLDADIKVRRRGTTKDDTSYRIDKDAETPLSENDNELIASQINLEEYFKPHTPEQILRLVKGEAWDVVMKRQDNPEEEENIEIR